MKDLIFHITRRIDWNSSRQKGVYESDTLSSEGFIHCSTSRQILHVANSFYADRHDLVLLVIDPRLLESELRWEEPPGSRERFPHIYGPLHVKAVVHCLKFEPDEDGKWRSLPRW